jgi:hypothetical protein
MTVSGGIRHSLDEADKCYDEIIRIDPNNVNAFDWKSIMAGRKGKQTDAIAWFNKALSITKAN